MDMRSGTVTSIAYRKEEEESISLDLEYVYVLFSPFPDGGDGLESTSE